MKWSVIPHYHINRYVCIIIVCTMSVVDTRTKVLCLTREHMTFRGWGVSLLGDSRLRTGPVHSVKTCPKHLLNTTLLVIHEMFEKMK